jgi:hypothetical protein
MSLKFIDAKQAKEIYLFKNIQRKLHKTTAAMWFNKVCRSVNNKNIKTNKCYQVGLQNPPAKI